MILRMRRVDRRATALTHENVMQAPPLGFTWHLDLTANCKGGSEHTRPYTPISFTKGTRHPKRKRHEIRDSVWKTLPRLTLLVKTYPEGNMSKHIHSMAEGDEIDFAGPHPMLEWRVNMVCCCCCRCRLLC
jgi:hypothetical protein